MAVACKARSIMLRAPPMEKPLLVLVPKINLGQTLASHPTFWLYIPGVSKSIDFRLIDDNSETGEKIYQTNLKVESEPGIISFQWLCCTTFRGRNKISLVICF
ncbi:DUF928 domain-containing protein [Okeania sp.]|uniref:DUF928 domain-containing protein n=1 Tax=Okeania sp. TaxID=3100323 RepID=UPI002B4ADB9D|nr:DUF928 domain-containing protein [Okeania sp.]MEB3342381.1 DUF928 domain-containing protein [Okeania sp.]